MTDAQLTRVVRDEWPRVVGAIMREFRDLDLAEDAAQEALTQALEQWPARGVPDNPGAWLTTAARRRAVDHVRRVRTGDAKLAQVAASGDVAEAWVHDVSSIDDERRIGDDELRLLFLCCHPALAPESQVALTLRSIAGLSTGEIARAYLVPEPTMAQRLVRAKKKVRLAGIPFAVPDDELLAERIHAVLTTVYLIFNEGYAATSGPEHVRVDLCREAIRLGRLLLGLRPDDAEVRGLVALQELVHARRDARTDAAGNLILLEDQDRDRWHYDEIDAALRLVPARLDPTLGPFALQAGIAAEHARAASWEATDWARILAQYDLLLARTGSPVVALNRAVAVAFVLGPETALAVLDELAARGDLADYHLLHASRADLLRRLGRTVDAAAAYREALARTESPTEQAFLRRRLAELT